MSTEGTSRIGASLRDGSSASRMEPRDARSPLGRELVRHLPDRVRQAQGRPPEQPVGSLGRAGGERRLSDRDRGCDDAARLAEHRVLVYESDEEFLAAAIPFLTEGIEQSHCVLAVMTQAKTGLLREALDDHSEHVEFADWADWYRSPKEALGRYGDFVKQKLEAGAVWIRIVGEAAWAGEADAEIAAWTRYESLVNIVFASSPATIICTYDERVCFPWTCRRRAPDPSRGRSRERSDGESVVPRARAVPRRSLIAQAGGPEREVSLLRDARGHPRRPKVGLAGGDRLAGELEQVSPHGVEPMVVRHALVRVERAEQREAGLGPLTIATATARLSVTTGPGETRSSTSYSARICGQSVSSALARFVMHRGDRRLQLIRADRRPVRGCG